MTLTPEQRENISKNLYEANGSLAKCASTLLPDPEAKELLYHAGMTIKRLREVLGLETI